MAERGLTKNGSVRHYLRTGLSYTRAALTELLLVGRLAVLQCHRLTQFGWTYGRKWTLDRRYRHAMSRLGESAIDMAAGDDALRASIAEQSTQQRPSRDQRRRRRQLVDRLAVSVLAGGMLGDSPAARRVVDLQNRIKDCERELHNQRASMLPSDPGQRRRTGVGMAALAIVCLALLGRACTGIPSSSIAGDQSPLTATEPHAVEEKTTALRTELGFFTRDEGEGKVIVDCVKAGSQAVMAGIRLGDQILAVGKNADSLEPITASAQLGRYVAPIGETLHVKWTQAGSEEPKTAQLVWVDRTPTETMTLTFEKQRFAVLIPWAVRDRFFKSGQAYEYVTNQSGLMGRPHEYVGKRIAVITELRFPEITPTRINLRLFDTMNSPQVHVEPGRDEGLFKAVVENDPIKHPYVIMHVELRQYRDRPALYGRLEEIMFLSPGAVDACMPLNEHYSTAAENRYYEEQKKKRERAAAGPASTVGPSTSQANPLLTGSGSSSPVRSEDAPLPWDEVERVLSSEKLESGLRDGRRFVLESGRLMLIDGKGVLHVLASPHPEGRASLHLFTQSRLFSAEEQSALASLASTNKPSSARIGRFDVSIDATSERVLELPKYWLRLDVRSASDTDKPISQASLSSSGAYTADELYTVSRHRRANQVIREALISTVKPDEIDLQVRMFDNLVEAAGLTDTAAFEHLDNAIKAAESKGSPKSVGVEAATTSLSYRVALCEDELRAKFTQP